MSHKSILATLIAALLAASACGRGADVVPDRTHTRAPDGPPAVTAPQRLPPRETGRAAFTPKAACCRICGWQQTCFGITGQAYRNCTARCGELAKTLRPGLLDAVGRCASDLHCGDDCVLSAMVDVEGSHHSATLLRCLALRRRCVGEGFVFAEGRCSALVALARAQGDEAARCLDRPCASVDVCLELAGALNLH